MTKAKNIISTPILALTLVAGPLAFAHSVKDLEAMLGDREKFFEPVDKNAPGFTLRNADGEEIRLANLRGKADVLHFIYTGCPDVCPLHAHKIAKV
jgi:protein SCO1